MLARAGLILARRAYQQQGQQLWRALATAAAPKLPDAPITLSGTSGSIATLVWQLALKENQLEQVQSELQQVVEFLKSDEKFLSIAIDPFMPVLAKVKIVEAIFKDSAATEITKRLYVSLAEENALSASLLVQQAYDELMLAHKKEVYCTLVTSKTLDTLEKSEMTKQAQKFVEPGFKLVLKEKVDKKLLGGFVLEFEDRLVDMSLAKKLEEFNNLVFKLEMDLKP